MIFQERHYFGYLSLSLRHVFWASISRNQIFCYKTIITFLYIPFYSIKIQCFTLFLKTEQSYRVSVQKQSLSISSFTLNKNLIQEKSIQDIYRSFILNYSWYRLNCLNWISSKIRLQVWLNSINSLKSFCKFIVNYQ
jgi:hypothetical protein